MENAELDVALEELESRLERLRALYEQYFMGIERIEPAIPRKDIDRRIYVLRREKIRNTAKRFKLQTIISRYNTFQQYWQRICREIEAGTYKRHVIKAERIAPGKILTIAARKRLGRHIFDDIEAEPAPAAAPAADSAPAVASPASSIPAPPSVPRPAPAAAAPSLRGAPPAKPAPPPKPGVRPAKPEPALPPAPAAAKPFESLDLDMDFMGDWDPTSSPAKPAKPARAVPPAPPPTRPFGEALARPLGAAPVKPVARAVPVPAAPAAPAAKPTAPFARPLAAIAAAQPAAAAAPAKPVAAGPPRPGLPAPPRPAAVASAPTPPTQSRAASAQAAKPEVAKPQPAKSEAAKPAAALSPAAKLGAALIAKPAKPAATATAALTDDRVRELHARLVEAKRETKDVGAVSLEGLAKSLKATEAKLREQHKNRKIDFDVVIKDGKAILKPTVR